MPRGTSSGCAAACRAAGARSSRSGRRVSRMVQAHLFDARSGKKSSMDLAGPQFATEPKEHVIHRAVVAELDSRRRYTAATKGRSEVRGSGAKLYRKKAKELLSKMELEGPVLLVLTEDERDAALSFRNLPEVTVVGPKEYGVYELLRAREVVFSRAAYSKLAGGRERE